MGQPAWSLRPARLDDRAFLLELHEKTMRDYVEQVWGWNAAEQAAIFESRFQPQQWQIIQVVGEDIGLLIVENDAEEIRLAEIEILPEWQGRGIGSSVVRSVMTTAAASGKPLSLRVLHVNTRARALYDRLGFHPFREIDTHTYLRWDGSS